jgi:sugar lactone lactonase YvrE
MSGLLSQATSTPGFAQTHVISTVAGGYIGDGGPAVGASLSWVFGVYVDTQGNIYTASGNHRIRRVDAATGVILTVAGNGDGGYSGDGVLATTTSLLDPHGVYVDNLGSVYIADTGNDRVRKVDAATGVITTLAGNGSHGYSGDGGAASSASLSSPSAVFVDGSSNVYISDTGNHRVRRVDGVTGTITTVAGNGYQGYSGDDVLATSTALFEPRGIFVDGSGNLYIADRSNFRIRRVDGVTGAITTVAGNGYGFSGAWGDGGPATEASVRYPEGLFLDALGNIYIADTYNYRIRKVDKSTGNILTVVGNGTQTYSGDGGLATNAGLEYPCGVHVQGIGDILIADYGNGQRIRKVDGATGVITTVAGSGPVSFHGDGAAAVNSRLDMPHGVGTDKQGNLYIADRNNGRVRKVNRATGIIATVAGNGIQGFAGDGGMAVDASLNRPEDVYVDAAGHLYVADNSNNRIRKVDSATGGIATIAGNGVQGFSGDGGAATSASLYFSRGVFVDAAGDVYIADSGNNRIRKVDGATGVISSVAGDGSYTSVGDGGPATSAGLKTPYGVFGDSAGNLFIVESSGHRVRRVDAVTGIISTVAGNGVQGYSGDGGPATSASLNWPNKVHVDARGDIYVADSGNHRIRRIDGTSGLIATAAGDGHSGFSGDGGPAATARLRDPRGVCVDDVGSLLIADTGNNRIRKVSRHLELTIAAPDTAVTYGQSLAIPVLVGSTAGAGIVSSEVFVAYDGSLLGPPTVETVGTLLTPEWTVESHVLEGAGTSMDTLKIATATDDDALQGDGDLVNLRFQVADVRHPASSPLQLVHVLFNAGTPVAVTTDGSVRVVGVDGAIARVPDTIIPRQAITVTVTEADESRTSSVAETLLVRVSNGAQSEVLRVDETGVNTGVFTGSVATAFSLTSVSGDGVVQTKAGDVIVFAFDDSLDAAGNTVVRTDTTRVIGGMDGQIQVTVVTQPGDTARVRVADGDLNTDPGLRETRWVGARNVRTGELEAVPLAETTASDTVFFGILRTNLGIGAGANHDGVMNTRKADTLAVTYVDSLTGLGAIVEVHDLDKVVNPFGDADGNGQVQAYDASRVLYHRLHPYLTGLDSLSANVDLQAPFAPITAYDAALILQKRVGRIWRFPVQEDESVNHPQPETDQSVPKPAVAERMIALQPGEGYVSIWAAERAGIVSGELEVEGITGEAVMAPELSDFLVASRVADGGVRVVFAGAEGVKGAGELVRLNGVGPQQVQLTRAWLNDGQIGVRLGEGPVPVVLPLAFALYAPQPNPFNPQTVIRFDLPSASRVRLEVYDVVGQRVRVLVSGDLPAGVHQVKWDGRSGSGMPVSSGVYLCRLQAGGISQMRRMLLVK